MPNSTERVLAIFRGDRGAKFSLENKACFLYIYVIKKSLHLIDHSFLRQWFFFLDVYPSFTICQQVNLVYVHHVHCKHDLLQNLTETKQKSSFYINSTKFHSFTIQMDVHIVYNNSAIHILSELIQNYAL